MFNGVSLGVLGWFSEDWDLLNFSRIALIVLMLITLVCALISWMTWWIFTLRKFMRSVQIIFLLWMRQSYGPFYHFVLIEKHNRFFLILQLLSTLSLRFFRWRQPSFLWRWLSVQFFSLNWLKFDCFFQICVILIMTIARNGWRYWK